MGEFESLLGRAGLLPHGYCFQWSPGLLWTMVGADTLTALAYFSIPLAIAHFVRRRPRGQLGWLPGWFAAFILLCGLTHVVDVWTIWRPDYEVHAATKAATAVISVITAMLLWRVMPQALAIPSVGDLQRAVTALRAEVEERRRAEASRDTLERALSTVLDTSGAGYVATDAEGRVTRMNAMAEAVTGWSNADALGQPVWRVVHREDRPAAMEQRNPVDVLREHGPYRAASFVLVARDGLRKPVELSADLDRRPDGDVHGITLVLRDVSRLSAAESELRRLAAVVGSSSDAIVSKTLEGTITTWNAGAERLFGWEAAEIIGKPVQTLIPPDRIEEEMAILADLARGRQTAPFDTVRVTRDGRRVEVSVAISPVRDALGHVIGGSKVARDLSAQRRAERALRHNEQRLRLALEAAAMGDWSYDPAHDRLEGSVLFARCLGLDLPADGLSREALIERVHPDDRNGVRAGLEAALASRGEWHQEFRVLGGGPSWRWLRVDGRWQADDGRGRMAGVAADTTARHEAERVHQRSLQLAEENRRVIEASRLKNLFLANMSHELRTPLNAVIGFTDLLLSGAVPADSPRHAQYLGHIGSSGRHLLQVINDVLDLSKIEAGRMELRPEPLDLAAIAHEVAGAFATQVDNKSLSLVVDTARAPADVLLDPMRLRQVVFNFLSNAVKFTPERGHVTLRVMAEGEDFVRIEVEDDGIGIEPEDQQRLFVEFQQLDGGSAKRHQGTGLGLALTRRLVLAQGGRVGVRSAPGRGTCFHAVLPRRADHATPRVLVAVSHRDTMESLARGLAEQGIAADTAASVAEMSERAAALRHDAWAVDLRLDGGQVLPAMQALTLRGASLPVRALGLGHPEGSSMFPVAGLLAKPLETGAIESVGLARRAAGGSHPVLVVDDDDAARTLMVSALEAAGLTAVSVSGGGAALDWLAAHEPSAVVLDLMMPGVDGFEVLARMRADARLARLPVFVWTALALDADDEARLAAAADRLVAKGGSGIREIVAALREAALPMPRHPTAPGVAPD